MGNGGTTSAMEGVPWCTVGIRAAYKRSTKESGWRGGCKAGNEI